LRPSRIGGACSHMPRTPAKLRRTLMACHRFRLGLVLATPLASLILSFPSGAQPAGTADVTIYRDEFGIPNIFADTEEGVCYGMGYAQAEDRLDEILKQYRRAEG